MHQRWARCGDALTRRGQKEGPARKAEVSRGAEIHSAQLLRAAERQKEASSARAWMQQWVSPSRRLPSPLPRVITPAESALCRGASRRQLRIGASSLVDALPAAPLTSAAFSLLLRHCSCISAALCFFSSPPFHSSSSATAPTKMEKFALVAVQTVGSVKQTAYNMQHFSQSHAAVLTDALKWPPCNRSD
jgi:hypothetical protein